jgi:hypothetical protein
MEPSILQEIQTKVVGSTEHFLIWIDKNLWGCVDTLDESKNILHQLAEKIVQKLHAVHPSWTIETVSSDGQIKVSCLQPGYIYNTRWTAHLLKAEPVQLLDPIKVEQLETAQPDLVQPQVLIPIPDAPSPPPAPKKRRRRRKIQD